MAKPRGFFIERNMKLKQQFETVLYVSDYGYYCISQPNDFSKEPSLVMLSPDQMAAIAKHWETMKEDHNLAWSYEDGGED